MLDKIKKKTKMISLLESLIILFSVFAQSFQLNYSTLPSFSIFFEQGIVMICVNAAVIAILNLVLALILRSWTITLSVTSILSLVWSIVNYYVIEFHGSPLFFSEFSNFGTAMAVASGYHFDFSKAVLGLLLIFAVENAAILVLHFLKSKNSGRRIVARIGILCVLVLSVYIALFSPVAVKPSNTMGWSWMASVREYGYISCVIEDAVKIQNKFAKPEGYSLEKITSSEIEETGNDTERPDIILILNETFCDLDYYSSVEPDSDYLEQFYEIENAVYGHVIVPDIGGGTNDSEFELLTSGSMYLLNHSAPFNYLRLDATGNNIVQNLKKLGYITYGMHCGEKTNYSRNSSYPMLGFDTVLLGRESFQYYNQYGDHPWLDIDNYQDMIRYYEGAGNDPRFMYLLTIQNHGGYEQNDPAYDTVHTQHDFGDLTDDVDEYLTSIQMSAEAFVELTEYFSSSDRHVIICMVGDHAPSFIKELPANKEMTVEESEIAKRVVPYVIWANYDAEFPSYTEYASMVDLAPMVLETAGLPLTAYYQYILNLHDIVPVRTSTGIYMDRDGLVGTYDSNSDYYELLTQYYYMEYNALSAGDEYRRDLFEYK